MSDRFDFLELGDALPRPLPPPADIGRERESETGWKPLRLRVKEVIGEQGNKGGQFSLPTGLAVDPWGNLYVADANNHRVQRITAGGDVWVHGRPGDMPGQLWGPQAVAVDPTGKYFAVAEQGNGRVQCFDAVNSKSLGIINGFRSPSGVAFDLEGMLWIADTGNARLLRMNPYSGQFVTTLDRAVGIMRPISVACDRANNLYVTDGATNDVTRYTQAGERVRALGELRRLNGPRQTAIDGQGRLYLAEAEANRLHVFAPDGGSLLTFEGHSKLGPLRAPAGVALGSNGEIYVADTLNHRVLRLAWD